jgi:hypothetical protein
MDNVECVGGDESVLMLKKRDGTPLLQLPRLPGEGEVSGIRVGEHGIDALRDGRWYFLSYQALDWIEAA